MIIQNLSAIPTDDGKLYVRWLTMDKVMAIQIQVARDLEFTINPNSFMLPEEASECILDLGKGPWFVRVAGWVGDDFKGQVKWSGVIGPFHIITEKESILAKDSKFSVHSTKPIPNGLRLYCNKPHQKWIYAEISVEPMFLASDTRCVYLRDNGIGEVDIQGIPVDVVHYIRYVVIDNLRKDAMTVLTKAQTIEKIQSSKTRDIKTNSDRAQLKSDLRVLEEVKNNPNMRFTSYTDYVRYRAAKTSH